MGACSKPPISTLTITTRPMAELERAIRVQARRGRKAQIRPMQVVKEMRKIRIENMAGTLVRSL